MKVRRSVMKLPQPLKGCLLAYVIAFAVAFVSVPDYSTSFFASPKFVRIFGVMFGVVGAWFMVVSTMTASRLS
jgi:hypothetical protein